MSPGWRSGWEGPGRRRPASMAMAAAAKPAEEAAQSAAVDSAVAMAEALAKGRGEVATAVAEVAAAERAGGGADRRSAPTGVRGW